VANARQELASQIRRWRDQHLIVAPARGKLSYLAFLETNLHVEPGKALVALLPENDNIIARAELPLAGSGKVKVGQQVNIKLANYPFEQFGMLSGQITSISALPTEQKYLVHITLPQELKTTQQKQIAFRQQLAGTTEIITEDLSVLERVFYQIRKVFQQKV
jgi:hypothetical protein